eukprot:Gb_12675 [translate_table: standard]
MSSGGENAVAVIMVGGPTKGTRFRPLSLNLAKPLFPLAGEPMVQHPIMACKKIPNLARIYLIGFYDEREFALYVSSISNELKIPVRYFLDMPLAEKCKITVASWKSHVNRVCTGFPCWIHLLWQYAKCARKMIQWDLRYLREDKPHGSAGGLYNFKELLMEDDPLNGENEASWLHKPFKMFENGVPL